MPRNRNYKNLGQDWEGKKSSNKEIIFFFSLKILKVTVIFVTLVFYFRLGSFLKFTKIDEPQLVGLK